MNQKHSSIVLIISLFYLLSLPIHAKDQILNSPQQNQPPKKGNFALGASQQPGPLISFGQNIIDKGQAQLLLEPTYLKTTSASFLAASPSFLYGLNDVASLLIVLPVALNYKSDTDHSSGVSDTTYQLEYAFYEHANYQYTQQATIVASASMPSGSIYKDPPTGTGAPALFLGTTYNMMFENWLWFTSPGIYIQSTYNQLKQGNLYLYQFGFNRVFFSKEDKYIFAGMLEFNGIYTEKSRFLGDFVPNTGGNVFGVTPSLWFSTNNFIAQLGVSLPMIQRLYGEQSKSDYFVSASCSWTFNL